MDGKRRAPDEHFEPKFLRNGHGRCPLCTRWENVLDSNPSDKKRTGMDVPGDSRLRLRRRRNDNDERKLTKGVAQ